MLVERSEWGVIQEVDLLQEGDGGERMSGADMMIANVEHPRIALPVGAAEGLVGRLHLWFLRMKRNTLYI